MGFKDLFKRKETLDAKKFCELRPFLQEIQLSGQFKLKNSDRQVYSVDVTKCIPEGYKRGVFEIVYDGLSKKLYCVVPDCGIIRIAIDNTIFELSTSDIITTNALLAGKVPVILVETQTK